MFFKHILHISAILFTAYIGIFEYPNWIKEGIFDNWYPMVGSFVAIYGGFIASLLWYIQNYKNL